MRALVGIAALGLGPLGLVSQEAEPATPEVAPADHAAAIAEVVTRFEAGEWDATLVEATAALEVSGRAPEWQRAELHYARGLAHLYRAIEAGPASIDPVSLPQAARSPGAPDEVRGVDWFAADAAFGSARALAGPGVLRRHAMYNLGVAHLLRGETWFATIPEVSGGAGVGPGTPGALPPGMPGMPGGPAAGSPPGEEGEAPDPLQEARAAYGSAKELLIERLREDWRDPDTRANLEWIQRRLRELDEIERQREEQEQDEEQDPNQDPSEDPSDDSKPDPDAEEEREDSEQDDSSENEGEENPSERQPNDESQEPEPSGDEEQQQDPQDSEPQPEPTEPETAPRPEEGTGESVSSDEPPPERLLTKEEVMRLLDRLQELEEEGAALEAALRGSGQIPVERDW